MEEEGTIDEIIDSYVAASVLASMPISILIILLLCHVLGKTSIYIQHVYIPALDTSTSTGSNGTAPFNASIIVDLKYHTDLPTTFTHPNKESELVVFYGHGITPVAGYRVGAFRMGRHKNVHKMAAMEAPELPWEEAFREVSAGSTVELVLQLRNVRRTDKKGVLVAHVAVDASGHMVPKGPVRLT